MTVPEYPPQNPPGVPGEQTRLTPLIRGGKTADLKFPGIEPRTAHSRSERLTTRPAGDLIGSKNMN